MKEKEKYEQLIQSSPLFLLDRERDRTAYQREALKMVEYLYCYLLSIHERRYVEYGLEITETAKRCIENFDASSGNDFLHYFNAAMAKEYRRASAKREMEKARGGLHVPEEEDRNIRWALKLLQAKGIINPTEDQLCRLADAQGVSLDALRAAVQTMRETAVVSDVYCGEDGEEMSLFDTVAADGEIGDELLGREACASVLSEIEDAFLACQDRQKPLLSVAITARICKEVCACGVPLSPYSFVDGATVAEYKARGTLPTQREIAARFEKNEASVSRTVKEFIEKLKK